MHILSMSAFDFVLYLIFLTLWNYFSIILTMAKHLDTISSCN